ncbi:hypothetical protein [Acaryochloris sp. CCMEE 5410]|uniref:hypothetical protein n=1 Tax=Acaryochloris sp. CCMEE 5410 TaxID=310037 RepID=UPI0002484445|nr:hypothetical protein [Acaryochloris sp. CCMEE 5410]KAI9132914.1 hypothetical protein ON05_005870 [Acaryochloris sp. CCMEE 5410]
MQPSRSFIPGNRYLALLVASVSFVSFLPVSVQAQRAGDLDGSGAPPSSDLDNVEVLSPRITGGLFSIPAGKRLMTEAEGAYDSQNFDLAANKLQDARQIMNQLSNFYSTLTSSFLGVDRRVSESHRKKALETAQLRDKSTYQLALVYRAQNKPEKAIPLLIEIIRSQNPSRDLGKKSYQQLVELGFSDIPYPRTPGAKTSTSPETSSETPEQPK